jgi:uroporphyrinogen decarboxylase
MVPAMGDELFLRACRREPVQRAPVWLMRQAGRYLPSYRAVRSKVGFLELCKTPDLACEVTLAAVRDLDVDAAILFSDILVPVEAMGMEVRFTEEHGPELPGALRSAAEIDRLRVADPELELGFVMEAVRRIKRGLAPGVALIGFSGAPFTLATYMVEGGTSKNFIETKKLLLADPAAGRRLLDRIADQVVSYLVAQVGAGCQALQLFDTWAGILAPADFDLWAGPYAARVLAEVRTRCPGVPLIYFVNGSGALLERMGKLGADVIGLDWKVDLGDARARLGSAVAVMGNLDPVLLFGPVAQMEARVRQIFAANAGRPGHVFNLGHGILPGTPVATVQAMVAAVKRGI